MANWSSSHASVSWNGRYLQIIPFIDGVFHGFSLINHQFFGYWNDHGDLGAPHFSETPCTDRKEQPPETTNQKLSQKISRQEIPNSVGGVGGQCIIIMMLLLLLMMMMLRMMRWRMMMLRMLVVKPQHTLGNISMQKCPSLVSNEPASRPIRWVQGNTTAAQHG